MHLEPTPIPGCWILSPNVHRDQRGSFVKVFNAADFGQRGLCVDYREEYYSHSHRGVIRGLHFQVPPFDHVKIVYCPFGKVFDALVDLRRGSPTYGEHFCTVLDSEEGRMLYIAPGVAHGFCVMSDLAIVGYKVSALHSPAHDKGIHWNSAHIPWPCEVTMVSARDGALPPLDQFESPFVYEPG